MTTESCGRQSLRPDSTGMAPSSCHNGSSGLHFCPRRSDSCGTGRWGQAGHAPRRSAAVAVGRYARITRSPGAFDRLLSISSRECNGMAFCAGCSAEMGVDVPAAIAGVHTGARAQRTLAVPATCSIDASLVGRGSGRPESVVQSDRHQSDSRSRTPETGCAGGATAAGESRESCQSTRRPQGAVQDSSFEIFHNVWPPRDTWFHRSCTACRRDGRFSRCRSRLWTRWDRHPRNRRTRCTWKDPPASAGRA